VIRALKWIGGLLGFLLGAAGTVLWLRRRPAVSATDAKRAAEDASKRAREARKDAQDLASLKTRQDRMETQERIDAEHPDLGDVFDRLDGRD
jgi:uncharacterized membrane protein